MKKILFVLSLLLTAPLAGCLDFSDDKPVVRVLTYDITAFSEEMFSTFTNETGYEIELILADDAEGFFNDFSRPRMRLSLTSPSAWTTPTCRRHWMPICSWSTVRTSRGSQALHWSRTTDRLRFRSTEATCA